ncbi:UNVERIFIED_CONTAM: hypothetical protein FKN15_069558 [Acipenser sinensis]
MAGGYRGIALIAAPDSSFTLGVDLRNLGSIFYETSRLKSIYCRQFAEEHVGVYELQVYNMLEIVAVLEQSVVIGLIPTISQCQTQDTGGASAGTLHTEMPIKGCCLILGMKDKQKS